MNEQEYINATNLAKARSAYAVLRDFCPTNYNQEKSYKKALKAVRKLSDELEPLVKLNEVEK